MAHIGRTVRAALLGETWIERQRCPLCGQRPALVRVADRQRDQVWKVCLVCARAALDELGPGCAQTLADRVAAAADHISRGIPPGDEQEDS